MAYEYERAAFGTEQQQPVVGEPIVLVEDELTPPPGSALAVGGLIALLGGLVLLSLAIPFAFGALSAAVVAPEGRKKHAAKWGAVAGGVGGMVAYPVMYGVTGNVNLSRAASALAPIALGAYVGNRER